MFYLMVLYWCSIIYWWFTPLKADEVLFVVCILSKGKRIFIWGFHCIWRQIKYYLRFVLYLKEVKCIDKCSMPYTLHDSFASEVLSWPMVRPYQYNLASYVVRGGVRCGCWCREVLYNLFWLFEEMRWYWFYWDYWVLYLQVFLILIVILLKCWLIQFVV
jgi:hypothetical protein